MLRHVSFVNEGTGRTRVKKREKREIKLFTNKRKRKVLGDAPRPPMFPPIFLRHLCIFLLIVASLRRSALAAPIPESDDHVT